MTGAALTKIGSIRLSIMRRDNRMWLQKASWIVPIPGTTKLSHLDENLRTLDFTVSPEEWRKLETAVAAIPVVGDRYNAEQQRQVGR